MRLTFSIFTTSVQPKPRTLKSKEKEKTLEILEVCRAVSAHPPGVYSPETIYILTQNPRELNPETNSVAGSPLRKRLRIT